MPSVPREINVFVNRVLEERRREQEARDVIISIVDSESHEKGCKCYVCRGFINSVTDGAGR
jgi:hypothetical protein